MCIRDRYNVMSTSSETLNGPCGPIADQVVWNCVIYIVVCLLAAFPSTHILKFCVFICEVFGGFCDHQNGIWNKDLIKFYFKINNTPQQHIPNATKYYSWPTFNTAGYFDNKLMYNAIQTKTQFFLEWESFLDKPFPVKCW